MNCRNEKFAFGLAGPQHSQQLLNIYESGDFQGNISILYTRRPDPYASLMREGEKIVIPIVIDKTNGLVVGMGACIIRRAYINGEVRKTGYLTGLKGLPEYRKRVPCIAQVYQYLYEQTKDEVDIYYTTILNENIKVQKMLEKRREHMPEYHLQGEYTVYFFRTGAASKASNYSLENGSREELEKLYRLNCRCFNFSPADLDFYDISDEDIFILRGPDREAVAGCTIRNQQSYKQYIVTEYRGIYALLKRIPLKITGYPDLPKENTPVNYGSIAMLTVKENDTEIAEQLIKKVAEKAKQYDFLMIGFFEDHPLALSMQRIRSIKYQSKLYTVHWDDNFLQVNNLPVNIEVGLL